MNHAELSRELALALGYHPESVRLMPTSAWPGMSPQSCEVYRWHRYMQDSGHSNIPATWHPFDYRAPTVVVPLIKWLMNRKIFFTHDPVFPHWVIARACSGEMDRSYSTLEECVARAVIAVKGKP